MMTFEEKIKMYRGKKTFIENISKAFEARPSGSTVASITYEVFKKEINVETTYFAEYLVVTFFGGAKSVRSANGNGTIANFQELAKLIDGGYYDEVRDYETILERGFERVDLEENLTLTARLNMPMNHISDVRACFDLCEDEVDVERVIRKIPAGFGTFSVDFFTDGTGFTLVNSYEENGDFITDTEDYDFYVTED